MAKSPKFTASELEQFYSAFDKENAGAVVPAGENLLTNFAPATSRVPGRKDDGAKLDLTLLFDDCPHALEAIAEVMQWAVTKKKPVPYERGSWQAVEPFQQRYRGAALRHELNSAKAVLAGSAGTPEEARDPETGLLELAHIATNAVFRLEKAVRALKGITK
jgi:hypothetical protein